ncbi:hypothetical protein CPAV1605_21 [seawater metagenome]|uniref:Uncharacterized protein n=1 Tax=seawater metagenome TaxID=1561972 RepID=A0A5E8CGK5_9ZZZZ
MTCSLIQFSLTMFTLVLNCYIIYKSNSTFSIYNLYSGDFLLLPPNFTLYFWNIILLLLIFGFIISGMCLKDIGIFSYFLSCIINCLFHFFLSNKNLGIATLFCGLLVLILILNMYEVWQDTEKINPLLILFSIYNCWAIYNFFLGISILLIPLIEAKILAIFFLSLIFLIKVLQLYFIKYEVRYLGICITFSFLLITISLLTLLYSDPFHYSFFGIMFYAACLIFEIKCLKKKRKEIMN